VSRTSWPAGVAVLFLAIALLGSLFLPGSALSANGLNSLAATDCVRAGVTAAAAADSTTAVTDSTAAPPAASTAADSVRTKRREFPHPDSTLVSRLRSGGYVIVFRHSITDWAQRDTDGEHFEDRSAQRNLSKEGETQAARIGQAIAELHIPIGTVLSSPMWRCRDTAQIAFGRHQPVPELFRRGPEYRAMRLVLLGTEPEEGKDMVLVTHQDLLIPIIEGLGRDQLKEGDAFVVKPLGEGAFEIVAQVTPEDWERLAADSKAATVVKNGKSLESTKSGKTPKK
jgi:phosphohistidine phosphatase SixA